MTGSVTGRALSMFSAATLTLATPVYVRMAESPGLVATLRLIVLLQILPTVVLFIVDLWLERRSPRAWRAWSTAVSAACLLTVARQAQISFRMPVPGTSGAMLLVTAAIVGLVGVLAGRYVFAARRFLAALGPALLVWTILMGYGLRPPATRATQEASSPPPPAVFVLLFDELDRDVVMSNGRVRPEFPNFVRLAARGRVFADATGNYAHTCASVGSLLTGQVFERTPPVSRECLWQLPGFDDNNLLTAVARRLTVRLHTQYLSYCFDGAFRCRGTAYVQARAPLLPLLQHYVPDDVRTMTGSEQMLGLSDHTYTLPVFEQFLRSVRAADARGTFSWVHVLLPHAPYVFDAGGVVHRPEYQNYQWNPVEYARALAAYRRQIGFVDRLLGRFLDRLQAEGLADEAIVIVTSDHGFQSLHPFAEPERIGGFEVTAARPRVTLILRAPGISPGVVAAGYQHVEFKRLVLGLIDGNGAPANLLGDKVFCDNAIWHVRDAAGRWRPQLGPDGRARTCGSGDADEPGEGAWIRRLR